MVELEHRHHINYKAELSSITQYSIFCYIIMKQLRVTPKMEKYIMSFINKKTREIQEKAAKHFYIHPKCLARYFLL